MTRHREPLDADAKLVRAAARRVGIWIAVAVSLLVIGVLVATLVIVFSQIPPDQLFAPDHHETTIDIEGVDIVIAAIGVGAGAILLAGAIALFVTRRAVTPLVDALRRQRHFVADASHELRTPLAILDARLQVLQRASGPRDPHAELIDELRDDSRALQQVVTDLLDSLEIAPVSGTDTASIDAVVESAAASMRLIAEQCGVTIVTTRTPPEVQAAILETSLRRSLIALLDNAVKHSPPGIVELTTRWDATTVTIAVRDHGPGIRGIDPARVFDRFARSSDAVDGGGSARTGFGIGLAIVNDTVTRYNGHVAVVATSPAGTTIEIVVPRRG